MTKIRLSAQWTPPPTPGPAPLTSEQIEAILDLLEPLNMYLGLLSKSIGFSAPMDEVAYVGRLLLFSATEKLEGLRT